MVEACCELASTEKVSGCFEIVPGGCLHPLYPFNAEGWYTPLVLAVIQGRVESVRILLDQGADAAVRGA